MKELDQQLGQDDRVYRFETAESAFQLGLCLVQQAQRTLRLVSGDLEKGFYDREPMVDAISRLARRNRYSEVQILIADHKPLVGQYHALAALSERLSSKISIRLMHPDYPNTTSSYLLVDQAGILYRQERTVYQGFVCFNDPGRCRQFSAEFDAMWQRATVPADLRRLSL